MGSCRECPVWQFGVCRDRNYCRAEREALMEVAQRLAEQRGHSLTEFARIEHDSSIFACECIDCGKKVAVDTNPGPDEKDMYGEALTGNCTQFEGDQGGAKADERNVDELVPDWVRPRK